MVGCPSNVSTALLYDRIDIFLYYRKSNYDSRNSESSIDLGKSYMGVTESSEDTH